MRLSDRRQFLQLLANGIAGTAAVRTWPFRVYSFPTNIALASSLPAGFVTLELVQEAFRMKHPAYGGFDGMFQRPFPRQKLMPWEEGYVSRRAWVDELPDEEPPKDWKRIIPVGRS